MAHRIVLQSKTENQSLFRSFPDIVTHCDPGINGAFINKLASVEAMLVRNSAHRLTYSMTGVKCRATSVAKNDMPQKENKSEMANLA